MANEPLEQYSVFWVDLNPTKGAEMAKVRPCVILSPTEVNRRFFTVISAPITHTDLGLPTRHQVILEEITGYVALDQMRALDKSRFLNKAGMLSSSEIKEIKGIIKEYLVD